MRFQLWQKMVSAKNVFIKERPACFTTDRNMNAVIRELRDKMPNKPYYFLKGPVIAPFKIPDFIIKMFWGLPLDKLIRQRKLFENLERMIRKETGLFSYRNIPFAGVISQKIKDNITDYMLGLFLWTVNLDEAVNVLQPSVVLSNGSRTDDVTLAELCKKKEIPNILISHGSHVRPKNEYESIGWGDDGRNFLRAPFSVLALQSPLGEGFLDVFPSLSKIIRTGPLAWGRPVNLQKSRKLFAQMFNKKYDFRKKRVILHAGTPKCNNGRCYIYETPDEYIQGIRDFASAVRNMPDTLLIVKFRPRAGITVDGLKELVPFSGNVVLSVDESFRDILGMADLLVSFSSTTIEEALQNRIPVLLYGGNGRYQHIPAYEIKSNGIVEKSAIYYVRKASDLECAVTSIFNLGINGGKDGYLFEPYIYPEKDRVSLIDLVKGVTR
jgi:hypothetical protein